MSDSSSIARAVQELNFLTTVLQGGLQDKPAATGPICKAGVTILSGFLGAGKTTLLRKILSGDHGKRVAVIVNDFGAVNLDAAEVARDHGDVIELTNGCSCCAMGGDFASALEQVMSAPSPPQHVMVEASGLSDPAALATLAAGVAGCGSVGIATLIDAHTVVALEALPTGHLFIRQIEVAHLIILTKTSSLADEERQQLIDRLAMRYPGRQILTDASMDLAVTFHADRLGARPQPASMRHDLSAVVTHKLNSQRLWTIDALTDHLELIPKSVLRLKGSVALKNGRYAQIQCVGRQCEIVASDPPPSVRALIMIGLRDSQTSWAQWADRF